MEKVSTGPVGMGRSYFLGTDRENTIKLDLFYTTDLFMQDSLIPMALDMGLGVMPWSPLKEGILSGKYTKENKGQQLSGRNDNRISPTLPEKTYDIIEQLTAIAKDKNVPVSAVAIA